MQGVVSGSVVVPRSPSAPRAASPRSRARRSVAAAEEDESIDSQPQRSVACELSCGKWDSVEADYVRSDYPSVVLQRVMDRHGNKEGSRATIDQVLASCLPRCRVGL